MMNYRKGLITIKKLIVNTEAQEKFLVLESSLLENLENEDLFGTSQQIRSDRARIVLQLNRLAMDNFEVSFNDLCEQKSSEILSKPQDTTTGYIGSQVIINTGGGNYYAGQVNNMFVSLLSDIDKQTALDDTQKKKIKEEISTINQELLKDKPTESFFAQRIANIKNIAPDIADVVLATVLNPAAGFSEIARKIAKKLKTDSEQ